jgi:hypothetical protein
MEGASYVFDDNSFGKRQGMSTAGGKKDALKP